jgi:hypothetical protein
MEHIAEALIGLAIIVIGALGTLVKLWIDRLAVDLAKNTTITTEARDNSNGRLTEVIDRLEAERDRTQVLRQTIRDREDLLSYIAARLPEADAIQREYQDRRTSSET